MSFILDALRKAEADRERGHVPSIHAQPVLPGVAPSRPDRGHSGGIWIALGTLLLVAVIGLTWWFLSSAPQRNAAAAVATTAPAQPVAAAPAVTPPPAASEPAPEPAPVAAKPAPKPKPKPAAPPPQPTTAKAPIAPAPGHATPPTAAAPGGGLPAATPSGNEPLAGKVYAITELPDAIRGQLPQVSVGGSMYSPVRANRILIVNGQVLHEGDRITPELVLEQVRVKGAVLAFRGYRYLISF